MSGLSLDDMWWMQNFDMLCERIEVFDPPSKSMLPVSDFKVPWPIVWVLARYNRKHIWANRKLPSPDWVRKAMYDFCQRMKWKWFFRNSSTRKPLVRFQSTSHCGHVIDPGLQFWLDRFNRMMIGEALRACKKATRHKEVISNMSPLVRWGIQLLKSSPWKACWTDKTSSYALIDRSHIASLHDDVFDKPMYMSEDRDDTRMVNGHYISYFKMAKRIELFEDSPELGAQLRKTANLPKARLVSRLSLTVKSHKPQGQVSVRNLHCSGTYSFKGIGLWVQHKLAEKLDCIPFLIKDPSQVGLMLKGIQLDNNVFVLKFDIKEFFVSGPLESLKCDAMRIFADDPVSKRRTIADAMDLLLTSQFIRSYETGRVVRVCEGSGMGLPQSGGIADAAFFCKAEKEMLTVANREQAGILAYLRFKDDGLIFSNNRIGVRHWFWNFKAKAGYFRIICDEIVRFNPLVTQELQFLQFRMVLCANTRKVRTIPHSKSVAVPLSQLSAHPPSTKNWPVAHLQSMCQLASDKLAAEETKREILTRFLTNGVSPSLYQQMLAVPAWKPRRRTTATVKPTTWWLPMPWHPAWTFANFGRVIRAMYSPECHKAIQKAFSFVDSVLVPCTRIAWRNHLPHSGIQFQKL